MSAATVLLSLRRIQQHVAGSQLVTDFPPYVVIEFDAIPGKYYSRTTQCCKSAEGCRNNHCSCVNPVTKVNVPTEPAKEMFIREADKLTNFGHLKTGRAVGILQD